MPINYWKQLFQEMSWKPSDLKLSKVKTHTLKNGEELFSTYWLLKKGDVEFRSGCNPFTGEMASATNSSGTKSPKEIGYASYIGLKGNKTDVEHIYNFISDKGDPKDRTFGSARFI